MLTNMTQYGCWPDCSGSCNFCLRLERIPYGKERQLEKLAMIKYNIGLIDWVDKFSSGISLLGGELYHTTDNDVQASFLDLIDVIIAKVLKVSPNPNVKYSTVTNGMYDPEFLFRVVDKIVDAVGIGVVDVNFSYDLKYRYKCEEDRLLVLENVNKFNKRYNYKANLQMILTQYVIDMINKGEFNIKQFEEENVPGSKLVFLYPHPIATGELLPDFNFARQSFLEFLLMLKNTDTFRYAAFINSTKNSTTFKYTGLSQGWLYDDDKEAYMSQQPELSDGKEDINPTCGHSTLYKCYSDSDKCMFCDIEIMR